MTPRIGYGLMSMQPTGFIPLSFTNVLNWCMDVDSHSYGRLVMGSYGGADLYACGTNRVDCMSGDATARPVIH